ncbi:MAG: aminotransferase class V-fold PLP-dependent enzyme [Blastocatellia bacterium]|nr:aminotransferase class V-fold PLP-dependent enzyme [Blastocatellia bacterium]
MIYLDNNATTKPAAVVVEAMLPYLSESFGNPSSSHTKGFQVREAISGARESVARLLGAASDEIVFTSGGTESDNWAILGALAAEPDKDHIVTTTVEHEAVRKLCDRLEMKGKRVTRVEVDEGGALDVDALLAAVDERTCVVSVMMANNETGVLFPVAEIAEAVKSRSDALFHVDGVNAAGKVPIDLARTAIDLFSISAHKFHGPKGVGALYIRRGARIEPLSVGGGQEGGRRAGTEAVHQIIGLGASAELAADLEPMEKVRRLRRKLEEGLLTAVPDTFLNGQEDETQRLPNTANISFAETNGESILARLDAEGICVATGSACNSDTFTASPVLQAMNIPYSRAMGSIRFSLGRENTEAEVDEALRVVPRVVAEIRSMSG